MEKKWDNTCEIMYRPLRNCSVIVCVYLCLRMSVYPDVFMSEYGYLSLCMGIYFSKQFWICPRISRGKKIMIRFVKRSFPGCLSDSRQLSTWHGFQFSQPQQFQPPHHSSAWGYLFVRVPLVDFFKCLCLPLMLIRCSWVECLELKKPRTQITYHFALLLFSLAASIHSKGSTLNPLFLKSHKPHPDLRASVSLHLSDSYVHVNQECWLICPEFSLLPVA